MSSYTPGSVALVHETEPYPIAYQRNDAGAWFRASAGARRLADPDIDSLGRVGSAELIHRGVDRDELLAEFIWDLFEVPNGAESWALALDTAQRNQVEYAKQVREFVKRQEEEGK